MTPATAVLAARQFAASMTRQPPVSLLVEIEVDTLEQLDEVLEAQPDLILLDNMPLPHLRSAVEKRNARAAHIELEASGGVTLERVAAIAETGVERISVGSLTHSATSLDVGLDWS